MPSRILETVLTGKDLLSPVLTKASAKVLEFNSTVVASSEAAGASAVEASAAQQAAAGAASSASGRAAEAAKTSAGVQTRAATEVTAANDRTALSATKTADVQSRASAKAAESATASARIQQAATRSLAASNGLLGTSLTPVTAGLGALALGLGYGVYQAMTFDKAMSQVQAATQASAGTMKELRDAALEAGAKTQYSSSEAAQGITELAKAGVSAKDILGGGLTGALHLAAAGQLSVADAASIAATALTVFGLKGSDMNHVADLLAAGAGKAQGSVGDLSMALNQSALVANNAGLSIEDTAGALALFASNGLLGSDAGTSFKNMLQRLTPQSQEAAQLMDQLGINAYDAQGNFVGLSSYAQILHDRLSGLTQEQRNSALATIFGSDAVRAATILYNSGAKGVDDWTKKVNDSGYASRQAAQLMDNLGGDLSNLGSSAENFFTVVGEGAQGPLRFLVQALTAIVNTGASLITFWNNLPGPVQFALLAMAGVAALKGPLASFFDTVLTKAAGMAMSLASSVGQMGALRTAGSGLLGMLGGPWALAIGAVIGSYGLMVNASKKAETATVDITQAQQSYADALRESNGLIDANVRHQAAKSAQDAGVLDLAHKAGVALPQVTDALTGNSNAYKTVSERLHDYADAQMLATSFMSAGTRAQKEQVDKAVAQAQQAQATAEAFDKLAGTVGSTADKQEQLAAATGDSADAATAAAGQTQTAAQAAQKAYDDWIGSMAQLGAGFVEPVSIYQGLLQSAAQATADATKDSKDSWQDYADSAKVSLDQFATELQNQITAQENWHQNLVIVAQRAGYDVAAQLEAMGVQGAGLVAQMANSTDAEMQRMAGLMRQDAANGSTGAAQELDQGMKVMAAIGAAGAQATAFGIAQQLDMGAGTVAQIAAKYGVNLATGINPLLTALGKPQVGLGGGRLPGQAVWNAEGNLYEDHQAQIAPGGAMRIWAEPETGGEAYIPLAESKRPRSRAIATETVHRLGGDVQWFADGGFMTESDVPRPPSTYPYQKPISTAGDAAMDTAYQATAAYVREQGPFGRALAWARSQVGKPYIWGGVGPVGYDCSGFQSAITNILEGLSPYSRVGSTANFPWAGFVGGDGAYTIGSTPDAGGGIGHMAATLLGVNVESRGGEGVVVGSTARGAHDSLFSTRAHLAAFDGGGWLQPGATLAVNGTGKAERIRTADQEASLQRKLSFAAATMPGYGGRAGTPLAGAIHVIERNPSLTYVDKSNSGMTPAKLRAAWNEMEFLARA